MLIASPAFKGGHSFPQSKQNPLYFTNPPIDIISKALTTFGSNQIERIVYMGPRYPSTYKLFRAYCSSQSRTQNQVNDSQIYGEEQMKRYVFENYQKQKYYPVRATQYRLFTGMNPTARKDELRFDSNFQCGNLDLVVSLGQSQYDLFLRVDSNTKGHTCWFFFKVQNCTDKQRIKFNIVNFSRSELSYQSGMKIYTYASSGKQWVQSGQNIEFIRGHKYKYIDHQASEALSRLYTLSFQYEFKAQDRFVYFAYCIPYSYSLLEYKINQLEKKYAKIVEVDRTNLSTGGLVIPILTITNKNPVQLDASKETCLVIGRLHPGETQGSWLLQGFLHFLCSSKAKQLRNKIIFKVIPMVNVDGVVAGNFRTNLLGRDLNRFFHHPQSINQIGLIRTIATKCKPFMFLDFHGHSSKKNIFVYGPDYSIDSRHFLPSRIFPKLISKCTKSFRYYACNFRISGDKINTGRAIMLRNHQVTYCFTVEASAHAYGSRKEGIIFDKNQYIQSGSMICTALDKFIKIIFSFPKRQENQLASSMEKNKQKIKSSKIIPAYGNINELETSPQNKKLFQQILNDQRQKTSQFEKGIFEQNDSDFQQDNDYTERELSKLLNDSEQVLHLKPNIKSKLLKKEKLYINKSHKNHSLHAESNSKFPRPKYSDEQASDYSYQKRRKLKISKDQSPPIERQQSLSMQLNMQPQLSPEKQRKIKIQGRHIHRLFSQESCVITVNATKLQNLNHLSLDYSINKTASEYEPLSESKRVKQKASILVKRRKGKGQYRLDEEEKQKNQCLNQIKKSLLPLLGTNAHIKKDQGASHIQQIFEKREIQRKNRLSKHIKIFYF